MKFFGMQDSKGVLLHGKEAISVCECMSSQQGVFGDPRFDSDAYQWLCGKAEIRVHLVIA